MEQEKEQLNKKISLFKKKIKNTDEFEALLSVISKMRHEQEEEANLVDKMREQRRMLQICDERLVQSQQHLIETKKAMGDETSAEEMLYNLKAEMARNQNLREEFQFEINEKRRKLIDNEKRLYEPMPSYEEISQMENKVIKYRTGIADLNSKL